MPVTQHSSHSQAWSLPAFSVPGTPLGHPLCLRHLDVSAHTRAESWASLVGDQKFSSPRPDSLQHCAQWAPLLGVSEGPFVQEHLQDVKGAIPGWLGLFPPGLEPLEPCHQHVCITASPRASQYYGEEEVLRLGPFPHL